MSKKNKKQFDGRRFFTEEDLEGLQMNDDGILEVGFGDGEKEEPISKKKGKKSTVVKRTSELDKRVAAILKKLDLEDDNDDENIQSSDTKNRDVFNDAMEKIKIKMEKKIEEIGNVREIDELKEQLMGDESIDKLRAIAGKHTKPLELEITELQLNGLRKRMNDCSDVVEKAKLRKEVNALENKLDECRMSKEADLMLIKYNKLKREVDARKSTSIDDDVRELYRKYGKEGIRRLLSLGLDEDDEDEREAI